MNKTLLVIITAVILSGVAVYKITGRTSESNETNGTGENSPQEEVSPAPKRYEDVANQSCEHDKLVVECNECRYEVGAVKVDTSLLKSPDNLTGLITTETVRLGKPISYIEVVGEIQPDLNKIINIRAKTNGVIKTLYADLGHSVKTDQIVIHMDSAEYQELHLEFLRLNALLKLAEKNFERENRLFQNKLTTQKEFLETQSELERIKIELDIVTRKLALLGLTDNEIKELPAHQDITQPCYLPVRTPLEGTVIEREVTAGSLVETNANLLTVADLSQVWVWVNLYEKELGVLQTAFKEGAIRAEVSIAAYPSRIFHGKADYIADRMDEHTRTVKARIVLDNPERILKAGMFVHCKLALPIEKMSLLIPEESLLKDGEDTFVFKQVGKDLFFKQIVKIGSTFADEVEVIEGLEANEQVVSQGAFILKSDILREKMGAGCAD